jgi:asparagine synthase (glutamine-hydrolysing)
MCGICGIIHFNNNPVQEAPLRKMMHIMKHRGPDDEGVYIKENIGFGFVRLSILDLSMAGHQPMVSNDGRYVIVLNGEIFNYIELREELKGFYRFVSNTDTEVLLASYLKWGESCLDRLNGMFAFMILDTLTMEVFGARDRFGIKPFYYYQDKEVFIFASDIPPILSQLKEKAGAEDSIIFDYLVFNRTNHTEKTFFQNVKKIPHGHLLSIKARKTQIKKWYDLKYNINRYTNSKFDENNFLEELTNSINLQLRSDVTVGTCLSGGLDSSAITSLIMLNKNREQLHSFSAVYKKGQKGDESEFIEEYNNTNLNRHFTYPTSTTLLDDLQKFITSLTEPVPTTSVYAEYKVMELTKNNCTVILNGQGADEILAGYHYFYGYYFHDLLKEFKWAKLLNELYHYTKLQKSDRALRYFAFSIYPRLLKHYKGHSFLEDSFYEQYYNSDNVVLDSFYDSKNLKEFLIKHFEYKFEHHLLWADKTGMNFSLETRFPFLDHHLVEKTLSLNSDAYIKKGYTKVIMRNALKGILPEKIRLRKDKIGFSTPEEEWFMDKNLLDLLHEVVYSESFKNRGYFNVKNCKVQLENYRRTKKGSSDFWKWIHLELWFRQYID